MSSAELAAPSEADLLECDYLVVGAGTAGMSFVDTLLSESPASVTVALVDRHPVAGGHWTSAYPFVRLHQPSCFYGVNSLPLGRTTGPGGGREAFDADDRATAAEIVAYYARAVARFEATGRVTCFFGAAYHGGLVEEGGNAPHRIVATDGALTRVRCKKVVTVASDVVVPSMRPPLIPVAEGARLVPVNGLPEAVAAGGGGREETEFAVLGAGKTGCDAVLELLARGVAPARIRWIVSRDVWFFVRDVMWQHNNSFEDTARFLRLFLDGTSVRETFLAIERAGFLARLDPDGPFPEVCKAPIVTREEVERLRTIKDVVRRGRVVSIGDSEVILERGSLPFAASRTVFVDCMAEDFYGYGAFREGFVTFEPGRIHLGPLFIVNNASFSSALVAYVEAHFSDDDDAVKNSVFFLPVGEHALGTPATLLGGFYAQLKTLRALVALRPLAALFLLRSRTNADSLGHRTGGSVLRYLWGLYGPLRIDRLGADFVEKIDRGGFSDVDHRFGNGRRIPRRSGCGVWNAIGIGAVGIGLGLALRGVAIGRWR